MNISRQQMTDIGWSHFAERMAIVVKKNFPDETKNTSVEDLRAGILVQGKLARRYGLLNEQQVAIFVLCAWLLGAGFDEKMPAAKKFLNDNFITESDKAQWLESFTTSIFAALES